MRRNKKAVYAAVAAFFILAAVLIYSSHSAYSRNFNISLSGQTLAIDRATSTTVFRATINYRNLSNGTLYAYAITSDPNAPVMTSGFMNESILPGARPMCGSYDCRVNVNEITLPRNGSSYPLTATVRWTDGAAPMRSFAIEIYNGEYFYSGSEVQNFSS